MTYAQAVFLVGLILYFNHISTIFLFFMHFIPPTPLILYIMSKISNALITQNKELHLEKSIFTVAAEGMQNFKMSWVHKSPPY